MFCDTSQSRGHLCGAPCTNGPSFRALLDHTAVISKTSHANSCTTLPNRPSRGRRGRFVRVVQQLACEVFERPAVPMLLVVFNVVPTTHETFLDVGRQGCCRGGLLPSQRRCSRRADTHRGRCTAADPLQRVKQAKPYCSQRVVGISVHRQVGSLQPNVGSQGTRGSQRSGCRSDSSPCLPALPPAVHPITVKLISSCLQHLTGSLANSPSRHPEAGGAAPARPRLPCKNRHPTGLAPTHCPGGVIPHPSYIKRRCARPDVAA